VHHFEKPLLLGVNVNAQGIDRDVLVRHNVLVAKGGVGQFSLPPANWSHDRRPARAAMLADADARRQWRFVN